VIGSVLVLASCVSFLQPEMVQRHDHPDVKGVKRRLASITIPEANLTLLTADCAITCWVAAVEANDPQHCGVSTIYQGAPDHRLIGFSCSNVSALTVPASVTVGAGSLMATFTAVAGTIPSDQTSTITATLNGSTQTNTRTTIGNLVSGKDITHRIGKQERILSVIPNNVA